MLLWSLVALPLLAGGLTALAGRRADRVAAPLGVVVAVGLAALAVAAAVVRPAVDAPLLAGIRVGLAVDALSALMVVTVAVATVAVLVFAAAEPELRTARFAGFVLLFAGAMLVTVTATTLVVLLMAWEVMGAMSWALIGYAWRDPARVRSAHTAFLTTRAADLGLYLAAGAALAGGIGTLALADLPAAAAPWSHVVAAGLLVAALGKSAQLPFGFWLSRAMAGPSPVSALLHSATMVAAGAYLLLRTAPLLEVTGWAAATTAWVGAATALVFGLVAAAQTDLKQLLAASTGAQLGFVVLAAGVGAVAGGAWQLVAHAATKSLLFLAAGAWLVALGTEQLDGLRGAARRHPVVGVAFTVGAVSLAGLPPLSLWFTKDLVLAAALARSPALYAVGLGAAAVSAVYSAKAVRYVWQPAATTARPTGRVTTAMRVPLVALAGLAAGLGLLPGLVPGALSAPPPAPWEAAVSAALAVAAVALTLRFARRIAPPALLASWLGLERVARAVLVRPVLALAAALARFDDEVLDRAVTTVPRASRRVARALAAADDGVLDRAVGSTARSADAAAAALDRRGERAVDGAVAAVTSGARALGRLARRPQTGQVHQYFAQAAVVLAVLALTVIVLR